MISRESGKQRFYSGRLWQVEGARPVLLLPVSFAKRIIQGPISISEPFLV
jgi:hypothetical protein